MRLMAIDPGNMLTAYTLMDTDSYEPIDFGKLQNSEVRQRLKDVLKQGGTDVVIEMVASYGMAVGRQVFETCVEIGRLSQIAADYQAHQEYVYRKEEKMNLCGSMRAKDSNIRQALIDRFAKFDLKNGRGTKANPDWFYGFHADIWAAYAVGVTCIDKRKNLRVSTP